MTVAEPSHPSTRFEVAQVHDLPMSETEALQAEVERLRALVVLLYPYVGAAPAGVHDLLEEEMRGPGWRDRVGAA